MNSYWKNKSHLNRTTRLTRLLWTSLTACWAQNDWPAQPWNGPFVWLRPTFMFPAQMQRWILQPETLGGGEFGATQIHRKEAKTRSGESQNVCCISCKMNLEFNGWKMKVEEKEENNERELVVTLVHNCAAKDSVLLTGTEHL